MQPQKGYYASFLVRLWQESVPGQPEAALWHGEAEHIQTGILHNFHTLNDLLAFLSQRRPTGELNEALPPDDR